ncbi:MAG TPA: serine hydrolase domain-containing protein [Verrucomicrobiota bacterium]|nr:serine hydrolase domain-containing protein [Verrucomicrobiota bacterium]HNU50399.1 serine hydrolase domain-containing protein [Verrucomicrobiota bacterium]
MTKLHTLFVLGTALLALGVSCTRTSRPLNEKLQAALDAHLQRADVKGASAAVVLPDGSVWRGASGISHPGTAMNPDRVFAIGSITKNVVATLMLQLAEEGKLSLDDPIGKWLPPYPHVDPAITIRQMLNHTSGLFMFWDNPALWDDLVRYRTRHFTPDDVLSYLKEPHFRRGEGFRYSNTGYLLAATIITRVTGSSLSAEMRRRFWGPLDLRSACLAIEEPYPSNLAHVWGDNFEKDGSCRDITFLPRVSHDSITYGSAGVFMTAADLARWTHALFCGNVLRQDSLRQMQDFGRGAYGLGLGHWGHRVAGGLKAIGHGGGNIGTCATMVHLPDYGVSVAVMVNQFGTGRESRIARDLCRITAVSLHPMAWLHLLASPMGFVAAAWVLSSSLASVYAVRKGKPLVLVLFGAMAGVAGWVSADRWSPLDAVLYLLAGTLGTLGLLLLAYRRGFRRRATSADTH